MNCSIIIIKHLYIKNKIIIIIIIMINYKNIVFRDFQMH